MVILPEICCDTCPYSPTCEEERDFLLDALSLDEDFLGDALCLTCAAT